MEEIATFVPITLLMTLLFYLSNREMRKSLEQSRKASKILDEDRIRLRLRLQENTQALRQSELSRLNELAKAAEFGRLAQGLFHDLMSPLTSIVLHTEKLKETAHAHKSLQKAIEASRRMTRYIHDIRTSLSREETERLCAVVEELENVLHILSFQARAKNVKIAVSSTTSRKWYGNPIKLRQVFSNVISNAIDSFDSDSNRSPKLISITLRDYASLDGTDMCIEIEDNGCGIPPQNLKKVFDPFFTTKPLEKGTGIGLTTVKNILEKDMSGTIELQSVERKGTVVKIVFPLPF